MLIIDAHAHLWNELHGMENDYPIRSLGNGKASFQGEVRQMMPPYMMDGRNTAEIFLSNMDYDQVSAAVITQEFIDGNQNDYLVKVKEKYPDRFKICGLADFRQDGYLNAFKQCYKDFDGFKIPAQRLINGSKRRYLNEPECMEIYDVMEKNDMFLSIDLADGKTQVDEMKEIINAFPKLKIAIGHFGMVNRTDWESQIALAENENVRIESGGITWLFHREFYPYPNAILSIKHAIQMVGAEKIMWGSDYPRTMTAITYRMSYDFILKSELLTEDEKRLFLGDNAKRFYGFDKLEIPKYVKNMVED